MINRFLTDLAGRAAPATVAAYKRALSWLSDVEDVRELTTEDLEAHLSQLSGAPSSRNQRAAALRAFFAWLHLQGYADHNPAADLRGPRLSPPIPRALPAASVEAMLGQATGRERALLAVLYYCGLRVSEAVALRRSDLDMANGLLHVRHGKGAKSRTVPMGKAKSVLTDTALLQPPVEEPEERIFPFSTRTAQRIIKDLGLAAGVGGTHPHQLRHSYATELVNQGVALPKIAAVLGHSSLNTTTIYAETSITKLRETYDQSHPRA